MWDLNDVEKIEYKGNYIFWICFDDGVNGEVDFSEYLNKGAIFKPLNNIDFFRMAHIEGGTIAWSNGADIAPETLYLKIKEKNKVNI